MEREIYIGFAYIMFFGVNLEYVEAKMLIFFFKFAFCKKFNSTSLYNNQSKISCNKVSTSLN